MKVSCQASSVTALAKLRDQCIELATKHPKKREALMAMAATFENATALVNASNYKDSLVIYNQISSNLLAFTERKPWWKRLFKRSEEKKP